MWTMASAKQNLCKPTGARIICLYMYQIVEHVTHGMQTRHTLAAMRAMRRNAHPRLKVLNGLKGFAIAEKVSQMEVSLDFLKFECVL